MDALGQNIAAGAALLFLAWALLRRVPVLGLVVRMATRLILLVSPLMLVVLVVGLVWFHGGTLFNGEQEGAAASPANAPMPAGKPRD